MRLAINAAIFFSLCMNMFCSAEYGIGNSQNSNSGLCSCFWNCFRKKPVKNDVRLISYNCNNFSDKNKNGVKCDEIENGVECDGKDKINTAEKVQNELEVTNETLTQREMKEDLTEIDLNSKEKEANMSKTEK